jgi:hypothetical protein
MFSLNSWRRWTFQRAAQSLRKLATPKPAGRRLSFMPELTCLEERTVPSTLTVTSTADSGAGSLRAAIAGAASGDTVAFAKNVHGTIKLTSGELDITRSLTIKGSGADQLAVSGNNSSRVFEIETAAANVSINGLTITRGRALDLGGGILNDGSNLTLSGDKLTDNVTFESATTGGRGGGLNSQAGTLTITNCQITGNQALGAADPSAVGFGYGGGIYVLAGSAMVSNSTISGNLARGGDYSEDGDGGGGGFYIVSSATIDGCAFSGNQAVGSNGGTGEFVGEGYGGAINDSGSVTISASIFDYNQAFGGSNGYSGPGTDDPFVDYSFGGAIVAEFFTSLSVSGSSFDHNQAIGGNNGVASGNDIIGVGGAEGGAINNEVGATATVAGCTFGQNEAIGGNGNTGSGPVVLVGEGLGGAIVSGYGGGGPDGELGPNILTVSNTSFTENSAQGGNKNNGSASVAGLVGAGAGAGIANYTGGTASVSGSVLDGNQASGGRKNSASGTGAAFANLGAGGGIFNFLSNFNSPAADFGTLDPSVVSVSGSLLINNTAQGGSGGTGAGGGIANMLSANTSVSTSVLSLNQADGGGNGGVGLGGGIYNDSGSSLGLTTCLVTLNHADRSPGIGGGIDTLGTFTVDASTFILLNHASTSGNNIGH